MQTSPLTEGMAHKGVGPGATTHRCGRRPGLVKENQLAAEASATFPNAQRCRDDPVRRHASAAVDRQTIHQQLFWAAPALKEAHKIRSGFAVCFSKDDFIHIRNSQWRPRTRSVARSCRIARRTPVSGPRHR